MIGWAFVPFIARLNLNKTEASRERIRLLCSIGLKSLALLACTIAVIGYYDSSTLVNLAFRGSYGGAVAPLVILLVSYPFVALNLFQVEMNTSLGYQRRNTMVALIMMLGSLIIGVMFVRWYGITGAAWTKCIAVFLGFLYLFSRFEKDFHWKYGASGLRLLLIIAFVFFGAWFIPHHLVAVRLFAIPLLFFIGTLLSGYFDAQELALWRDQIAAMFTSARRNGDGRA